MKPSYYTCGKGSDMFCILWDDIKGCRRDCKFIGDKNCEPDGGADDYDE